MFAGDQGLEPSPTPQREGTSSECVQQASNGGHPRICRRCCFPAFGDRRTVRFVPARTPGTADDAVRSDCALGLPLSRAGIKFIVFGALSDISNVAARSSTDSPPDPRGRGTFLRDRDLIAQSWEVRLDGELIQLLTKGTRARSILTAITSVHSARCGRFTRVFSGAACNFSVSLRSAYRG
jgi:hypothetical protein